MRKHLTIHGLVQGVFFRATMREQALRYGVTGWVRNTYEGDVEAVVEGEEEEVQKLVRWCHKGPPGAVVRKVEVSSEPYSGEYSSFSIEHLYRRW